MLETTKVKSNSVSTILWIIVAVVVLCVAWFTPSPWLDYVN